MIHSKSQITQTFPTLSPFWLLTNFSCMWCDRGWYMGWCMVVSLQIHPCKEGATSRRNLHLSSTWILTSHGITSWIFSFHIISTFFIRIWIKNKNNKKPKRQIKHFESPDIFSQSKQFRVIFTFVSTYKRSRPKSSQQTANISL